MLVYTYSVITDMYKVCVQVDLQAHTVVLRLAFIWSDAALHRRRGQSNNQPVTSLLHPHKCVTEIAVNL